jgi:hypothetical protein
MAQRRHHYERAFEELLRRHRVPYVAVDESRRSLLPLPAIRGTDDLGAGDRGAESLNDAQSLKSFDFVIYAPGGNLLVDIKGRLLKGAASDGSGKANNRRPRLESWVASEDVSHLQAWSAMFGAEFQAAFVFLYASDQPPTTDLFDEIFEYDGTWYAPRVVGVDQYAAAMRVRSPRWGTVDLEPEIFLDLGGPLLARGPFRLCAQPESAGLRPHAPLPTTRPFASTPQAAMPPSARMPAGFSPWDEVDQGVSSVGRTRILETAAI